MGPPGGFGFSSWVGPAWGGLGSQKAFVQATNTSKMCVAKLLKRSKGHTWKGHREKHAETTLKMYPEQIHPENSPTIRESANRALVIVL